MSAIQKGIIATFSYLDDLCDAIRHMREHPGFTGHEIYTPTSYHEIEHAAGYKPSPVRFCTLIGALTGTISGFALPLFVDWDWPLVVGGKTPGLASLPAFVVIGFELTILLGAFGTIFGMLWFGRLANPLAKIYDVRTTDDKFAVVVPDADLSGQQASLLKQWGAEQVRSL